MRDPMNTTEWDGAACEWCGDDAMCEYNGSPSCGPCRNEHRNEDEMVENFDIEPDDQHDAEDER